MTRVAVVGAGSWGTAIADVVARNAEDVVLWARRPELAGEIDRTHENRTYLPGIMLASKVRCTADALEAATGADVVVMAVPSHGFRAVLELARPAIAVAAPVVSLAKGVEQGTLLRMSEIVAQVLPAGAARVAVLTGPNLAREVAEHQPTASVIAARDPAIAARLQQLFMTPTFRVYTNPDVVGCEIAGALKNVIAIAAGIAVGLGFGDNTVAALITRGLAELARLGVALGGDPLTFAGLAGMGDLVATCISDQSRNRAVGVELARGRTLEQIVGTTNMVAEGVRTTQAVVELGARHGVDMPIAAAVDAVLAGRRTPSEMLVELMLREAKPELHGIR